jgi:hypothetical protein
MKLSKLLLVAMLIAGGLIAGNSSLLAQIGPGASTGAPAGGGGVTLRGGAAMLPRFQAMLGETNKLTADEITKVTPVLDAMIKKQVDLGADTTVVQADRATRRAAITTEASDAIKAIVTPSQFAVIQPLLQGGGRRGGTSAPMIPAPAK